MEAESDDWIDSKLFNTCEAKAERVREGYWSAFVTLAWIVSRDEKFVAAAQLYESECQAEQSSVHSASAWMTLSSKVCARFNVSILAAEDDLREALESNRLAGGIATETESGRVIEVQRFQWTTCNRSFQTHGAPWGQALGYFHWPSDNVRGAFPASDVIADELPNEMPGTKGTLGTKPLVSPIPRRVAQWRVEEWFREIRCPQFKGQEPPNWKLCWEAAKEHFAPDRVVREVLRDARREAVPPSWWKTGISRSD